MSVATLPQRRQPSRQGISVDGHYAHGARERIQDSFASDPGGKVGQLYGAFDAKNKVDNRSLFVVGPDGRVAYVTKPFTVLTPSAYTELAAVVDSLSPPPKAASEQ